MGNDLGLGLGFAGLAAGAGEGQTQDFRSRLLEREMRLREMQQQSEERRRQVAQNLELAQIAREAALSQASRMQGASNDTPDDFTPPDTPTVVSGVRPITAPVAQGPGLPPTTYTAPGFEGPIPPTDPAAELTPDTPTINARPIRRAQPFQRIPGITIEGKQIVPDEDVPIYSRQQIQQRTSEDNLSKYLSTPQTLHEGDIVSLGGRTVAQGADKPMPGFEGAYIQRAEEALGRKLTMGELDQVAQHLKQSNEPADMAALRSLNIELARQRLTEGGRKLNGFEIKPGTKEDRVATDLSNGTLNLSDFQRLMSRGGSPELRLAFYDAARQKNPNWNPSLFEMGYKFATDPETMRQMASMENVVSGVNDLLAVSDEAARSNVPILNQYVNKIGYNVAGKHYANLEIARKAFADELSGALGFGGATDMAKQLSLAMTDTTLSPQDFSDTVQRVIVPFIARKRASMLGQMGPYGQPGMNPAADAQARLIAVPQEIVNDLAKAPDGSYHYTDESGAKLTVIKKGNSVTRRQ